MKKNEEIEWKLQVDDEGFWPQIESFISALPNIIERQNIVMAAHYFDTKERQLNENKIAYRIRKENEVLVATIKAGGSSTGGLHKRMEANVPVKSSLPDLSVFSAVEEVKPVLDFLQMVPLYEIVVTDFVREAVLLTYKKSKIEIAMDKGWIRANGKSEKIAEVELELKAGREEDLALLGTELCNRFPLKPEAKSKYYRGLLLYRTVSDE
jgi:inorganic triphosphatase YgiF